MQNCLLALVDHQQVVVVDFLVVDVHFVVVLVILVDLVDDAVTIGSDAAAVEELLLWCARCCC